MVICLCCIAYLLKQATLSNTYVGLLQKKKKSAANGRAAAPAAAQPSKQETDLR